jgi:N-sulfoglucosamine sulfohydrolase
MFKRITFSPVFLILLFGLIILTSCTKESKEAPNILWITSEDNSAYFLGCYGNDFATTPNLDKLSGEGFQYTRAYAPSPVCHPSRNSIITGVYAASNGNENWPVTIQLPILYAAM